MDKKLLTPQDGLDAIARMTPGTKKFFREKLAKIIEEEMAGYEEAEGLNQTPNQNMRDE